MWLLKTTEISPLNGLLKKKPQRRYRKLVKWTQKSALTRLPILFWAGAFINRTFDRWGVWWEDRPLWKRLDWLAAWGKSDSALDCGIEKAPSQTLRCVVFLGKFKETFLKGRGGSYFDTFLKGKYLILKCAATRPKIPSKPHPAEWPDICAY